MKLTFEIINARDIEDGDIFYCTPDIEMNEFGTDMLITGTDQIFIRDDYYDEDEDGNHAILVNGGWNIWFKPNEKVVRLGHYSDLVRVLEMVKMGNPDMEVGPNDSTTLINDHLENHPEDRIDLLANLDIDFGKFKKNDPDLENDSDESDDDDELPF